MTRPLILLASLALLGACGKSSKPKKNLPTLLPTVTIDPKTEKDRFYEGTWLASIQNDPNSCSLGVSFARDHKLEIRLLCHTRGHIGLRQERHLYQAVSLATHEYALIESTCPETNHQLFFEPKIATSSTGRDRMTSSGEAFQMPVLQRLKPEEAEVWQNEKTPHGLTIVEGCFDDARLDQFSPRGASL